jgi:hypothetical protein
MTTLEILLSIVGGLIGIIGFFVGRFFVKVDKTYREAATNRVKIAENQLKLEKLVQAQHSDIKLLIEELRSDVRINTNDIHEIKQGLFHTKDLLDITNSNVEKVENKVYSITNKLSDRLLTMEVEHKLNHNPKEGTG